MVTWADGMFETAECNYDVSSVCYITDPDDALVDISEAGYYSVYGEDDTHTDDLFTNSEPPPKTRRSRGIRSVSEIDRKAYAIGIRGMVYRLEKPSLWRRIDEGLPETFDGQAIHGFKANEIYAVGMGGQLWHYDGEKWRQRELPTNQNLTCVKCAGDGAVYIGGHDGVLFRGRLDQWVALHHEETIDEDVWDLEWFDGALYVSTIDSVFRLKKTTFERIDFGTQKVNSCYQLSAAEGVLWSSGEFDVMSFDGKRWTRVV
jgi:hypothetical protein